MFKYFKNRTLRFDILTLFLILLVGSLSLMMWYTYKKNKEIVIEATHSLMKEVSDVVINQINHLVERIENFANIEIILIKDDKSISFDNEELVSYMLTTVKVIPDLSIVHMSKEDGSFLALFKLLSDIEFRAPLFRNLPDSVKFVVEYIDRSVTPATQTRVYKDVNGVTLYEEKDSKITFDPRVRPWFTGARDTKKPFWTKIYQFQLTNIPGISVGIPLFNKEGKLLAVSGGDIELLFFSKFLSKLQIGQHGKAMILSDYGHEGRVIAAPNLLLQQRVEQALNLPRVEEIDPIFAKAYRLYLEKLDPSFLFDDKGVEYIASFVPYTSPSGITWHIATIVPSSDFLSTIKEVQKMTILMSAGIIILACLFVAYFSKTVSSPIVLISKEILRIKNFDFDSKIEIHSGIKEIFQMRQSLRAMQKALKSFGRYVPKDLVKHLLEEGHEIQLGGEKKEIALFFSDIANFTAISESMPTEELMKQLSLYFEKLSAIILQNHGTIDKYIADGIMAFWEDPSTKVNHACYACISALLCHKESIALNEQWKMEDKPLFVTLIGLHLGTCTLGNIGTLERMNYTSIGDVVNISSRLKGVNKIYNTNILISEEMKNRIGDKFLTRPIDILFLKGKTKSSKIYELLGAYQMEGISPTDSQIVLAKNFELAFKAFHENRLNESKELFLSIQKMYPEDGPTLSYLKRLSS